MKIAVSNIAWQLAEEEAIAQIMQALEIKGVKLLLLNFGLRLR